MMALENKDPVDLHQILQDLVYIQGTVNRLVFILNDCLFKGDYYDSPVGISNQ